MGWPRRSRESGHGDPHSQPSSIRRWDTEMLSRIESHINCCHVFCFFFIKTGLFGQSCWSHILSSPSLSVVARRGLWPVLLLSMKIKAKEFIENNLEAVLPHLLEVNTDNQVWKHPTPLCLGADTLIHLNNSQEITLQTTCFVHSVWAIQCFLLWLDRTGLNPTCNGAVNSLAVMIIIVIEGEGQGCTGIII